MTRRTRNHYCTEEQLTEQAKLSPHPKQAAAVAEYIENNWHVYAIKSEGNCQVVCMQRGEMFGVMYPNGRFIRPLVGQKSANFNWADVRAAATL